MAPTTIPAIAPPDRCELLELLEPLEPLELLLGLAAGDDGADVGVPLPSAGNGWPGASW